MSSATRRPGRAERRAAALAERRDKRHRARERAAKRERRAARLRRAGWLALSLAMLIVGGLLAQSSTVPGLASRLLPAPPPLRSYAVTYLTHYPGATPTIEQDVVLLPFYGSYLVRSTTSSTTSSHHTAPSTARQAARQAPPGAPPGAGTGKGPGRAPGGIEGGTLTNSSGLWTWRIAKGPGWALTEGGLHPAAEALLPVATLDLAIRHLDAGILGTSRVAGHRCNLVETGNPPGEPLSPPSSRSSVTLCISRSGVVLSERWTLNGKLAESKTAVYFDPAPKLTAAAFAAKPRAQGAPPPAVGTIALTKSARRKLTPELAPFDGLRYAGGWVHATSTPGTASFGTEELYASRSGTRMIEVRYQGYRSTPPGIPVRAAGGRTGYLQLNMLLDSLTLPAGPSSSVVLESTSPALLEQAALHLRWQS
ncbi:MAG: hypothetical protein M0035_17740 [Actinomycetota bacterium]|nr:hypothetical protein [Actinomycetota bacterium]